MIDDFFIPSAFIHGLSSLVVFSYIILGMGMWGFLVWNMIICNHRQFTLSYLLLYFRPWD